MRNARIVGGVVVVAMLLVGAPTPARGGAVDGSLITFNRAYSIGFVNSDGSNLRTIQPGPYSASEPDLSPDGSRVLYGSNSCAAGFCATLYTAKVDGSDRQPVFPSVANGSKQYYGRWSPDDTRVAFVQTGPGVPVPQPQICVATIGGTDEHCLATGLGPWWAPDGQHLAYQSVGTASTLGLWITDLGGTGRQITSNSTDRFPSWSPDGQHLSFWRDTQDGMHTLLMIINSDGSGLHSLREGGGHGAPSWSPDASQMAVPGPQSQIAIIDRDGSIVRLIGAEADNEPTWIRPVHAVGPCGTGYWLVGSDGGVFAFGDHAFHGSTGGLHLNQPIVGMAATPDGGGYWLVASDGGIFSFGDANFRGSTGGLHLNQPIVGMAATPDGGGYWLVASDGGIFSFGDANFHGSSGLTPPRTHMIGVLSRSQAGYWATAADGEVYTFGDSAFCGSTYGIPLARPIVGLAS